MIQKTISGHYGSTYSIEHNNRVFIPRNVDAGRICRNYSVVAAGQEAWLRTDDPRNLTEFWILYKDLSDLYWKERTLVKTITYERYRESMQHFRQYAYPHYPIPHDPLSALLTLLFLPLLIPCQLYLDDRRKKARAEWEAYKSEQLIQDLYFKAKQSSLRQALNEYDLKASTCYLQTMDAVVTDMANYAQDYTKSAKPIISNTLTAHRFANIEEIYDKLYEPSFQAFQAKQRPCRRYDGTYLQQIREKKVQSHKNKANNHEKNRCTAEAIEIVFGIGDMDNTGYYALADTALGYLDILPANEQHKLHQALSLQIDLAAKKVKAPIEQGSNKTFEH